MDKNNHSREECLWCPVNPTTTSARIAKWQIVVSFVIALWFTAQCWHLDLSSTTRVAWCAHIHLYYVSHIAEILIPLYGWLQMTTSVGDAWRIKREENEQTSNNKPQTRSHLNYAAMTKPSLLHSIKCISLNKINVAPNKKNPQYVHTIWDKINEFRTTLLS